MAMRVAGVAASAGATSAPDAARRQHGREHDPGLPHGSSTVDVVPA
jgi:hypothetical protein